MVENSILKAWDASKHASKYCISKEVLKKINKMIINLCILAIDTSNGV